MPFRQLAYLPDRRSTRIPQSVLLTVRGVDAARAAYQERISTLAINCHGCRYLSRHKVPLGEVAMLELTQQQNSGANDFARARVVSAKQLPTNAELFEVAVEFEFPRDIWGIKCPPQDWAEFPRGSAVRESAASGEATRELQIVPRAEVNRAPAPSRIQAEPQERFSAAPEATRIAAMTQADISAKLVSEKKLPRAASAITDPSLNELCTQVEGKAIRILGTVARAFVEDLTGRLQEMNNAPGSSFSTYEHWMQSVEQEIANVDRRASK